MNGFQFRDEDRDDEQAARIEEAEAYRQAVEELHAAMDLKRPVLHLQSGAIGTVKALWEKGDLRCRKLDNTETFAPFSLLDGDEDAIAERLDRLGIRATLIVELTGPLVELEAPDEGVHSFWVRPGAFVVLEPRDVELAKVFAGSLRGLVGTFAVASGKAGCDAFVAVAIVRWGLREQLSKLAASELDSGAIG